MVPSQKEQRGWLAFLVSLFPCLSILLFLFCSLFFIFRLGLFLSMCFSLFLSIFLSLLLFVFPISFSFRRVAEGFRARFFLSFYVFISLFRLFLSIFLFVSFSIAFFLSLSFFLSVYFFFLYLSRVSRAPPRRAEFSFNARTCCTR